jgi:hypothetical protein
MTVRSHVFQAALSVCLIAFPDPSSAQTTIDPLRDITVIDRLEPSAPASAGSAANGSWKSFTKTTPEDLAALVDSTWGPGMTAEEQREFFDDVWGRLDRGWGGFHNFDVDFDALRDRYLAEIGDGVSRGHFAAILNHLSMTLQDAHTFVIDRAVNWNTAARPGIPLLWVGAFLDNSHFGATLTPLEDGSLLVIKARADHVLGLEPGDRVLGYEGVPWRHLYRQLLAAGLPIHQSWSWGSTEASMHHVMMMSAGNNWHLFETIDIVKYDSGQLVHLDTSPLRSQRGRIFGNEQLPVPGVPMPDLANEDYVTWGVIDGTEVGYIYVASWHWEARYQIRRKFYDAVRQLMDDTVGLILDFRLNLGGGGGQSDDGFSLLFDSMVYTMDCDLRAVGSADHLETVPHPTLDAEYFKIRGSSSSSYDKPIAALIGPGAVSAGDVQAMRLSFHPHVRFFGKPTNGAFTVSDYPDLGPRWHMSKATGTEYLLTTGRHLAHTGVPVDEEVWLTADDVARGRDTVVEAAMAWIHRQTPRPPRRPTGRVSHR